MTLFQDKRWVWIFVVMYSSILGIVCKDEWSKVETVITGCSTVLKWHIHNDFNDTITITRNNVKLTSFLLKDENISISKPMEVKREVGETETVLHFVINNATLEDTGHYICTLDKLHLYKHTQLTVIDFQWNNDDEPIKVRPGDDVTIKWEYMLLSRRLKKNIFLYTEDKTGVVTMLAFWFNGVFKSETTRMTFNLTKSENSFVENIYLTLYNTTTKDYNLSYYLKLDCHRGCAKSHQPITLIEDVGFKWIPVNPTPVKTSISRDVELMWNYQTEKSPNKIIITRKNATNNKVENIGMWTPERGFKIETNLTAIFEISQRFETVNHSTTTEEITNSNPNLIPGSNTKPSSMDATTAQNKSTTTVSGDQSSSVKSSQFEVSIVTVNISQGRITLRLLNVNNSDVDMMYYCHVQCGDWFTSKQGVTLTEEQQLDTSPATNNPSLSRMTEHEMIVLSASLATTVVVFVLFLILFTLATRKLSQHYNKDKERPKSAVSTNSNSPSSSRYPYKPMSGLTSYIARPDVEPTKRNSGGLREFLHGE
ncbi:uncharacterized protein LOC126815713 isoform X2 [Patella vulgata]|uniref:uncharacterized protein LOC126815713 isoform X2 n=1 Tax=Patella vulgata TaxID=6465 RepID=UPI00218094AF|nr:uncharacterized protein LOC126815713 isoform X2 [Patella vulgata]